MLQESHRFGDGLTHKLVLNLVKSSPQREKRVSEVLRGQRWTGSRFMRANRDLTDSQWDVLDPLIPEPSRRKDGRGRPWRGRREVLDGVLFILRTGAAWADLPERYPPY